VTETQELEILELDLDWDLINHLAIPDSFALFRAENLSPDLIEDEYVERVYKWALDHYREHGKPATGSALEATFDDVAIEAPLTAPGDLLQRLRERYVKNYGRAKIKEVAEDFKRDPLSTATSLLKAGRELAELTLARGESWGTGDHDRSIHEYHRQVARGPGASHGFELIDDHTYGQRGITFWVGPPKGMKSWFGVNGTIENILSGRTVHLYSLELPAYETNMRIRCMAADVPWWKFLKNRLDEDDMARLKKVGELLDDMGTFRVIKPPMDERDPELIVTNSIDAGADVIYIDQLQYLNDSSGTPLGDRNDPGLYWGVGNKLRNLSDHVDITVIHQFNRSVIGMDEMPDMRQAKGSSMIEEVGTLVMGIWANKPMRASGLIEVGVLASRNYDLASWEVKVEMKRGCHFEMVGRVADE
jgi:hypothetical protein